MLKSMRIINLRNYTPLENETLIRVDRHNPILGNRFIMTVESERNEVCDQYQEWFDKQVQTNVTVINELVRIRNIAKEKNVAFGCWCTPKRCHASTILLYLFNLPDTLECSTKGDNRFSSYYAEVSVCGKIDSIENHYQLSKRIGDYVPKTVKDIKGKKPTHFMIGDVKMPLSMLSLWYKALWFKYFLANKHLLAYINLFDDFHDMFKGKRTVNCQADVIREIKEKGLKAIRDEIQPMNNYYETEIEKLNRDEITIAGTGHRPNKLFGYDLNDFRYKNLKDYIKKYIKVKLKSYKQVNIVSGMALGYDTILADAALELRDNEKLPVTLICAIPCDGQYIKWNEEDRKHWKGIVDAADKVIYVSDKTYTPSCMNDRNKYMVDISDAVLAYWDGTKGGTYNCVSYATSLGKEVFNIHHDPDFKI